MSYTVFRGTSWGTHRLLRQDNSTGKFEYHSGYRKGWKRTQGVGLASYTLIAKNVVFK